MKKEERNYAFIDSQNVNLSIREQWWKLDWKKLIVPNEKKYSCFLRKEARWFIDSLTNKRNKLERK